MGINMVNRLIGKHSANDWVRFARLRKGSINHHAAAIEGAERKDPPVERRWNLAFIGCRRMRAFADENGVAGPVWVVAVVRDMVDEQQCFSRLGVIQLDAARECRLAVGSHADRAVALQILVA